MTGPYATVDALPLGRDRRRPACSVPNRAVLILRPRPTAKTLASKGCLSVRPSRAVAVAAASGPISEKGSPVAPLEPRRPFGVERPSTRQEGDQRKVASSLLTLWAVAIATGRLQQVRQTLAAPRPYLVPRARGPRGDRPYAAAAGSLGLTVNGDTVCLSP